MHVPIVACHGESPRLEDEQALVGGLTTKPNPQVNLIPEPDAGRGQVQGPALPRCPCACRPAPSPLQFTLIVLGLTLTFNLMYAYTNMHA